jgi:hypothetical protein
VAEGYAHPTRAPGWGWGLRPFLKDQRLAARDELWISAQFDNPYGVAVHLRNHLRENRDRCVGDQDRGFEHATRSRPVPLRSAAFPMARVWYAARTWAGVILVTGPEVYPAEVWEKIRQRIAKVIVRLKPTIHIRRVTRVSRLSGSSQTLVPDR